MASTFYNKRLINQRYKVKRGERTRSKTYATKEAAKKYMEEKGLKGTVEPKGKKFVIVS